MTNTQAARLRRAHIVATCVCANCNGALLERRVNGGDVVLCPRGCKPGYVARAVVEQARHRDLSVLDEVAGNYPWLDPRPKLTPEQNMTGLTALFGKDD